MPKTIYTKRDIQALVDRGVRYLHTDDDVVVTMEARETAEKLGIELLHDTAVPAPALAAPDSTGLDLRRRARNLGAAWPRRTADPEIDLRLLRLGRLGRLRTEMRKLDCAAVILTDPINIRYATDARNMTPFHLRNPARTLFVPAEGPVILFEFAGCTHLAAGLETIDEVRPGVTASYAAAGPRVYEKAREWAEQMDDLLRRHAAGQRIGLERFHPAAVLALQEKGYRIMDAQEPIERARSIKHPEEIKAQMASLQAVERGVRRMRQALRPGLSENELWALLHRAVIEQDGEYIETRLLTSGTKTNPWFQETGPRRIETGELVALDTDVIGPFGYYADFSRTFYCGTGKPSAQQRSLYQRAVEQVQFNMALIRPGMTFREFAQKAWPIPDDYFANRYFLAVHGVGMTGEYPYILHQADLETSGYDGVIEPGMTLCVESYIGEEHGAEGVKFEEQVLVTEHGIEKMSQFPLEEQLM